MTTLPTYQAAAVERTSPSLDLTDPDPISARHAVREMLLASLLSTEARDDLILAVSEVVTNAVQHGDPPIHVRSWIHDDEVVVTVTDCGCGPIDADAGLRPAERSPGDGGFGLWLAHQLCAEVTTGLHHGGFTVRLVARAQPVQV